METEVFEHVRVNVLNTPSNSPFEKYVRVNVLNAPSNNPFLRKAGHDSSVQPEQPEQPFLRKYVRVNVLNVLSPFVGCSGWT